MKEEKQTISLEKRKNAKIIEEHESYLRSIIIENESKWGKRVNICKINENIE